MKKATLTYYSEKEKKFHRFELKTKDVFIGRSLENTMSLQDDPLVSRSKHAGIFFDDSLNYVIVDMKSVNGVYVNEKLVERHVLSDGDVIRLGKTELIFSIEESDELPHKKGVTLDEEKMLELEHALKDVKTFRERLEDDDYENLKQASRRLKIINFISQRLQGQRDAETALQYILSAIFDELYAERAFIGISLDSSADHFDHLVVKKVGSRDTPEQIRFSRTLTTRILQSEKVVMIDDVMKYAELKKVDSIRELGVRSLLGMSIPGRRGMIGIMYFDNLSEASVFTEKDIEFLAALSPHIGLSLENILERKKLEEHFRKIEDLREMVEKVELCLYYPGNKSKAVEELLCLSHEYASTSETILLTGETGTGKSFLAQYIHRQSLRRNSIFQSINLPGLSAQIIESELFGHARGAFTGAERDRIGLIEDAEGGTLFLDEIGDVDLNIQAKLLEFLDSKKFRRVGENRERKADVRFVLATNKDLEQEIAKGAFRADFYRRINVLKIHVPPLRERIEDIPELCRYIIYRLKLNAKNYPAEQVSEECISIFEKYEWSGNIGELQNILKRAFYICKSRVIRPEHLPRHMLDVDYFPEHKVTPSNSIVEMEKAHIRQILKDSDFNITKAAKQLGISRTTLYKKIRDYGIQL